ncbi:GP153-like protein [Mya arenaria]|uniref:GP153-like protein n=1 Tax=Mya arenaria TaxID=6604 RepID=A0ABY7EXZ4_MYAAR|nr:uncharacterized protein LOC128245672 [Mya arenaria]XP_052819850.1 uncharacterized protein LOC128245672 [Mya arenaria]WAR13824.1 GP153-like protein [Mya arenaria]
MLESGHGVTWLVVSPLAVVTDVLAIIVISHYFPYFHGTDVALISVVSAMIGNVVLTLPIPAYLGVRTLQWSPYVCDGFTWGVITFRIAQVLSLLVMSIHWSTLLKLSAQKKRYVSTKYLKFTVFFVWMSAAIFGILPLIGAVDDTYNNNGNCHFLPFSLGTGYCMLFIVLILLAMLVSLICCIDAMVLIKHMAAIADQKYQEPGRFRLPTDKPEVTLHGGSGVSDRQQRLQFAWDLSKFSTIFIALAFAMDHLPFTVIQGIQLFSKADTALLEVVSLYLTGAQALLLPHVLWLLSNRYRHALAYQWRVHVLRDKNAEEFEPIACILQSYISRERGRLSLPSSRPASAAGRSISGTLRSTKSEVLVRAQLHINGHGRESPMTVTRDATGMTSLSTTPVNGVITSDVHIERPPSLYDERPIDVGDLSAQVHGSFRGYNSDIEIRPSSNNDRNKGDVRRSVSSASKDNPKIVRKKHLPPIFINEGYEANDKSPSDETVTTKTAIRRGMKSNVSGNSLHFYMSSDYHPDFLTDSLPHRKMANAHAQSFESDNGERYSCEDIDDVLKTDEVNLSEQFDERMERNGSVKFKTFKGSPASGEKGAKVNKGMYGTFQDLSKMDLKNEEEIEFDNESISIDEIGNVPETVVIDRDPSGFPQVIYETQTHALLSFKPKPSQETRTSEHQNSVEDTESSDEVFITPIFDKNRRILRSRDSNTKDGHPYACITTPNSVHTVTYQNLPYTGSSVLKSEVTNVKDTSEMRVSSTDIVRMDSDNSRASELKNINSIKKDNYKQAGSGKDDQESGSFMNAQPYKGDISLDDENASSGSGSSVTISPYKEAARRKPWMEDFDEPVEDFEPLVEDSDTDTFRTSLDSADLRSMELRNYDTKYPGSLHDDLSTPVSSLFDEETDRGFEEALDLHVNTGTMVYGGMGLCFESIKEEPEDLTSSGSNPFLENGSDHDEFKTRAVISRSSKSDSRTSSCTSLSDNPFSSSPVSSKSNTLQRKPDHPRVPLIVTTDADYGDSGFTSGLEKGNASDSSGHQKVMSRSHVVSPWPEETTAFNRGNWSFESDFSADQSLTRSVTSTPKIPSERTFPNDFGDAGGFMTDITTPLQYDIQASANKISDSESGQDKQYPDDSTTTVVPSADTRKPVHPALAAIRSGGRPLPLRVRSLERSSPVPTRRLPRRGHSFEMQRPDFKPAYF